MPELVRFTEGTHHLLHNKRKAVVLKLTTKPSTVFTNPCAVSSVLLKIVAINADAEYNGHPIRPTPIKEFQDEVHIHQDVCERSPPRFRCSIAPSILYADVYTKEELRAVFPRIEVHVKGRVGLIFMELITHNPSYENPDLNEYIHHTREYSLLEKARRLFIMLGQLGFFHNDFHLSNVVVIPPLHGSVPSLLVIDFGRATAIPPAELALFNQKVQEYDTTPTDALRQEILGYLYRIEYKGYDPDDHPTNYGWFKAGNIADEVTITAPILLDEIQQRDCVLFQKIPYETREFLKRNGHLLKDYTAERSNKTLVLHAVANFGEALEFASEDLRNDKEVVMTAVSKNGMALRFASPAMREDIDVLQIALGDLRNPRTLQFAIRPPKDLVLPHLGRDGLSLLYVPVVDKEMIMTAVSQNGMALHYVNAQDHDMVMAAVSQNGMALQYVAHATKEVVIAAVSNSGMALQHAPAVMKGMKDVVMAAVHQNGIALMYASPELRTDEEVVFAAILQDGRAIYQTTLRTPKLLLYASLRGYTPTDEDIKLVLPFAERYISESMEPNPKRQRIEIPFKEKYKERIAKIERETAKKIQRSIENLNSCTEDPGSCAVSGGKNKKLLYGSRRKSLRTRTKSRRTRCKRNGTNA